MFDRCFNLLLAALLHIFFLPLFVCYLIVARLDSARSRADQPELSNIGYRTRQIAGSFSFERPLNAHAYLEAYENLVDFSLDGGRL